MLLMRLSEQQNNQQRKAVRDVEITEAYHQFVHFFNQEFTCDINFTARKLGDRIPELISSLDTNARPFAVAGQRFGASNISVSEIRILNNDEVTSLINSGQFPGLSLTEPNRSPLGHTNI